MKRVRSSTALNQLIDEQPITIYFFYVFRIMEMYHNDKSVLT